MPRPRLKTPEEGAVSNTLSDRDFYARANEQAALLRARRFGEADIEDIAEEIESMGRGEKRELVNSLAVHLLHLLNWQYQPPLRGNSWRLTVEEQRYRLEHHLNDNPSLRSQIAQAVREAYRLTLVTAERETGLVRCTFPKDCPYTFEQAMTPDFWPE